MVIAAYDVADDGRRSHLAAILQVWGDPRLQRSVFLLQLEAHDLAELQERAAAILDATNDSLYLVRVCKDCWQAHRTLGQAYVPPPTLMWAIL